MLCNALSCQEIHFGSYVHFYKMPLIHENTTRLLLLILFFHMNSKPLELVIFIWSVQIINSLLKPLYLVVLHGQLLQQ